MHLRSSSPGAVFDGKFEYTKRCSKMMVSVYANATTLKLCGGEDRYSFACHLWFCVGSQDAYLWS